ncbi:MAG: TetR family transcriptional regulator [Pseudomonadota bacterium]
MPQAIQKTASRKRRNKGEQTRTAILEAALDVIAREGLRGVTHRAVAESAGVQLSLTTYYFKDIDSLITQAFELFCERSRPTNETILNELHEYLQGYSAAELRKRSVREAICHHFASRATDILLRGVLETPEGLAVEQAFFSCVPQSPDLRQLAANYRLSMLAPLTELVRRFNTQDPEIDAALLLDTLTRLEYDALLVPSEAVERQAIERLLRRQIGWALGLKRA